MDRFVYADNAATTPLSPAVLDAMLPFLKDGYGNPSSLYRKGREAKVAVDEARAAVAARIGANEREIIFTGGGSEADNLAIKGYMHSARARGKHMITTKIEHHAVLYTAQRLEKEGFAVTYLDVDRFGRVDPEALRAAIRPDTALVSIMAANNEIGTVQPLEEIGRICREAGVVFHTDAVQAVGHIEIDVERMNIDMLSMAGHKFNGPKGVGALYLRRGIQVVPLIDGGGQERKLRSGTENVAGVVGIGQAAKDAKAHLAAETERLTRLLKKLIDGVLKIPYTSLTGDPVNRLPGTASFVIECIEGESLVLMLDLNGIASSTGSACSTGSLDPSHVLLAIGLPHEIAHGSLRLTIGTFTTEEDVDYIIETLPKVVERLRAMSPVWDEKVNGAQSQVKMIR